jgi:hypothetical protein
MTSASLSPRVPTGFGDRYLDEASNYADDVIACTRDVCN